MTTLAELRDPLKRLRRTHYPREDKELIVGLGDTFTFEGSPVVLRVAEIETIPYPVVRLEAWLPKGTK